MKKQKENSHEGITWSEMGKQNVQAEKVYFTGSNLNIDKAMKRKLIQVTNSHELDQLINNTAFLSVAVVFV